MGILNLFEPVDLLEVNVYFPASYMQVLEDDVYTWFSTNDWRADVPQETGPYSLPDFAVGYDVSMLVDGSYQDVFSLTDIGRPIVPPLGGELQYFLWLVLDGRDTIYGTSGDDGLSGYKKADTIFGRGGNDFLLGANGNDTVFGGAGNDTIFGGTGHDTVVGNMGNDTITGGNGADILKGGRGDDVLTGGTGSDTFFFRRGDGSDNITDFQIGTDTISIGRGARTIDDLDIVASGSDVVIRFSDVEITVFDVTVSQMNDVSNFDL